MNRLWIGSWTRMNLKSAIRNLKFAIIMLALLFALSVSALAQQPTKVPRIGFNRNPLLRTAQNNLSAVARSRLCRTNRHWFR
jgi:hypothetical protein